MANKNMLEGYACPKCPSEGPFNIQALTWFYKQDDARTEVLKTVIWTDESLFQCCACRFEALAKRFKVSKPLAPVVSKGEMEQAITKFCDAVRAEVSADIAANFCDTPTYHNIANSKREERDTAQERLDELLTLHFGE